MAKSKELGLELTSGNGVSFETWRKSINGDNDGEIVELSNMQILDEAIGELQEVVTTIKDNIKDAIEDKGVIVGETPFNEYHLKVVEIGEGNSLPQLNAPTISRATNTLTVSNPSTNGNFLQKVKLLDGDNVVLEKVAVGNTTIDLLELGSGNFDLSVKASNPNFRDSEKSNSVSYNIYAITSNLTDLTTSSNVEIVGVGDGYTTTLTPSVGMYLPTNISVTMGGVAIYNYSYNNDTGSLSISNISGNIVITASASIYAKLDAPVITLNYDILSWSAITNADEYTIIANNQELVTTSNLTYNLIDLELTPNIYYITVIARGSGYQKSNDSNQVDYRVGVIVFGVTGLNLVTNPLTRTDDAVSMSYYINSSTGVITTDFDEYFPEEYAGDYGEPILYSNINTRWENEDGEVYTGNVFRKINKFYKQIILDKLTGDRKGIKIALSSFKPDGYYCPAYFMNENDQEMDYILIGVYKASNSASPYKYQSKSSTTLARYLNNNLVNYGKLASNESMNMFSMDWRIRQLLLDLHIIFFNTRQSSAIWPIPSANLVTTGGTNSSKNNYQHGWIGTRTLFLGIEDFLGNGELFYISGISRQAVTHESPSIYYTKYPSQYSGFNSITNTILDYAFPLYSNYSTGILKMSYDSNVPDLEIPTTLTTTSTDATGYCARMSHNQFSVYFIFWAEGRLRASGINEIYTFSATNATSSAYYHTARLCAQPWGVR